MLANYRQRAAEIDEEVEQLQQSLEREQASEKASKMARTFLAGAESGIEIDDGETQYRKFAEYARDVMITKYDQIAALAGGESARQAAMERKNRAPGNTLSSNLAGLQPPQYLAQMLDVIDRSRPMVATANNISLQRGSLTYPRILQRPTVALQSTEKTEGGTANMQVELVTVNASTYIGGGNISWQAVQWSNPDALSLWFELAGEAYAVQTETKAASVLGSAGAAGGTATTLISGSLDLRPGDGGDRLRGEDRLLELAGGAGHALGQPGRVLLHRWPDQRQLGQAGLGGIAQPERAVRHGRRRPGRDEPRPDHRQGLHRRLTRVHRRREQPAPRSSCEWSSRQSAATRSA